MNQNPNDCPVKEAPSVASSPKAGSTRISIRDSTMGTKSGESPDSSAMPEIPGYTILATLGQGGMGDVFKANQERLDRIVALKVIRQDRQDTAAVGRFRREARAAAKLSHPNIVVVHDFDQVGDNCFIAMEYVEGIDLYHLVKDHGPLGPRQACDFVRQVALGLQHAHERGLVHRDIKPANLLVAGIPPGQPLKDNSLEGTVKILDMGMALLHGADKDSVLGSPSGGIMGTPDYMAPEQALDFRKVDIRADLYSLGCTFYFLLTGRPPFDEYPLMRKLMMHQTGPVRPVWEVRSTISPEIDAVVQKLLAKKVEDRYQTPAEVAHVLTTIIGGEKPQGEQRVDQPRPEPAGLESERATLSSTRITLPEQVAKPTAHIEPSAVSGNPPTSVAPDRLPSTPIEARLANKSKRDKSDRLAAPRSEARGADESKHKQSDRLAAPRSEARGADESKHKQSDRLAATRSEAREPDEPVRENADASPVPQSPKKMAHFRGPAGGATALAFGPNRDILAAGGLQGALRLWEFDAAPREKIVLQTYETGVWSLVFAPDQRTLAWGSGSLDGLVCLGDLTDPTLNRMTLLHRHQAPVDALAYSADGKMLATGSRDQTVRWWELTEGDAKELAVFKGHKADVTGVAFSPDGKTLASASRDGTVRLWKRGGFWSKEKAVLEGKWGGVRTVAFAPLAPALAFGCQDQTVRLFALNGNAYQEAAVLRGHGGAVRQVLFPMEGKTLISICEQGVAILWDLATGTETHRWSLAGSGAPATGEYGLALTPDGRYIAIGSPEGAITVLRLFSKKGK